MRGRFWVAYGALAAAFALLVPTLAPLAGSMDSFAQDLAEGAFRPFGPQGGALRAFSESLGGFTGRSDGNYLPGAAEIPDTWVMDRDGRGGNVVIDAVFNPSLGAMKRLKAYDKVEPDGATLGVSDPRFRPYAPDPTHVRYDRAVEASFRVQLSAGEPVPIFSPHARPAIRSFSTSPPVPGGISFLQDGADTLYVLARVDAVSTLNVSFMTEARYFQADIPPGLSVRDYAFSARPALDPALVEDAKVVLARAGAGDGQDLASTVGALNVYFRSFTEGEIPPPSEVENLYLALALGGHGCCRHRAFAYMVTAQALGIPTRVVVNEAHAFVELVLPDGSWRQVNLGGCGTYTVNNPHDHPELFGQAHDPRGEANPDEDRPLPTVVTFTNITEAPTRIVKGERYFVNGTVETPGDRPAPGLRIDVFLNETKETPGRLTGAGVTDARGEFSIVARVPRELPARSYQLVARAEDPGAGSVRYIESWSDPEVDVFAPTRFLVPRLVAAVGFPADVSGRLVDLDNNPVPGASVNWTVAGTPQGALRTDAAGRFSATVRFDSVGERDVSFRFAGGAHHGAATLDATVQVEPGALLLPPEVPTLARGETGHVIGSVAVAGVSLVGREVRATVYADNASQRAIESGTALTDATGAFSVPLPIRARTAPGVYPVRYEAPALGLHATGLLRIAIRPTLALEAPATLGGSDAWVARAILRSDNGTPLAGGIVELVVDGNASSARTLLTNRTGVARFEFVPRTLDVGSHVVLASFPGDADHAEATATARVEVARPWFAAIPLWAYAAAALVLALVVLLTAILRRGGPVRRRLQATRRPRPERWRLEASFPDHPHGVDAVFEPGEEFHVTLRVRRRDGANVAARLVLDAADGRQRGRADGTGWTLRLRAPEGGPLVARARTVGLARFWSRPLDIVVPVLPYRRAVEEGFVRLRERARLGPHASPADLVRALGPRLPSAHQQKLREATSLFEVADYSDRPVDRAFYHAFATARRDLERVLEAGGRPP